MSTSKSWNDMYLSPFRNKAKKLTKKVCEQNDEDKILEKFLKMEYQELF